jgi:hypothetical protein
MRKTGHVAFIREIRIKYRKFVVKSEGKTIIGTLPHSVDCTGDKLTVNWEGVWKEVVWPNSSYYPGICLG